MMATKKSLLKAKAPERVEKPDVRGKYVAPNNKKLPLPDIPTDGKPGRLWRPSGNTTPEGKPLFYSMKRKDGKKSSKSPKDAKFRNAYDELIALASKTPDLLESVKQHINGMIVDEDECDE